MTSIYIAGPMTGLPDFNYPAFNAAAGLLKAAGFHVLSPVDNDPEDDAYQKREWHWYVRRSLRQLLEADAVATLPGWEGSRGAQLEVHVANALSMPVRSLLEWLDEAA